MATGVTAAKNIMSKCFDSTFLHSRNAQERLRPCSECAPKKPKRKKTKKSQKSMGLELNPKHILRSPRVRVQASSGKYSTIKTCFKTLILFFMSFCFKVFFLATEITCMGINASWPVGRLQSTKNDSSKSASESAAAAAAAAARAGTWKRQAVQSHKMICMSRSTTSADLHAVISSYSHRCSYPGCFPFDTYIRTCTLGRPNWEGRRKSMVRRGQPSIFLKSSSDIWPSASISLLFSTALTSSSVTVP